MSNDQPTTPAGWYDDPTTPGQQRYWDGTAWTGHTSMPAPALGYAITPPMNAGTNGMAIASMVLGILWIYWIGSILALIFGYVALSQIKQSGQNGRGMAIAGVVLGWIGVGVLVLIVAVFAFGGLVADNVSEACSVVTVSADGSTSIDCS